MRDLEADLEICAKATPGPWRHDALDALDTPEGWVCQFYEGADSNTQEIRDFPNFENNIVFVREARTGWPHAIQRALDAEERVDKLEHELRMLQDVINQRGPQP